MKCEHCENPASIHVTHVADGKVVKTHLCEDCAAKLGIANPAVSLADTLLGPGSPVLPARALTCPACGLSLRKFQKEGRLGCPACYQTFAREVQTVLRSLHDATAHKGRTPRNATREPDPRERLAQLRLDLSAAVKSEAFEEAARIRDDIRELTAALAAPHPEPASP
jgi:protein arginine kinase activator